MSMSMSMSTVAHAYLVWSTSVTVIVSYPAHRTTDRQTDRQNDRSHNSASQQSS